MIVEKPAQQGSNPSMVVKGQGSYKEIVRVMFYQVYKDYNLRKTNGSNRSKHI